MYIKSKWPFPLFRCMYTKKMSYNYVKVAHSTEALSFHGCKSILEDFSTYLALVNYILKLACYNYYLDTP